MPISLAETAFACMISTSKFQENPALRFSTIAVACPISLPLLSKRLKFAETLLISRGDELLNLPLITYLPFFLLSILTSSNDSASPLTGAVSPGVGSEIADVWGVCGGVIFFAQPPVSAIEAAIRISKQGVMVRFIGSLQSEFIGTMPLGVRHSSAILPACETGGCSVTCARWASWDEIFNGWPLVPMGRIELPASPLPRECSATELHGQDYGS